MIDVPASLSIVSQQGICAGCRVRRAPSINAARGVVQKCDHE